MNYVKIIIIASLVTFSVNAQNLFDINNNFNKEIGTQNSYLFNGKIYTNKYRFKSKENQYLGQNFDFSVGNLTIDGITFENLELKYDVFTEELIIKPDSKTTFLDIVIDNTKVNSFKLQEMQFINIQNNNNSDINGYFELAYETNFITLLIKHKKRKFQKLDASSVYYEFENNYEYIIKTSNNYHIVDSRKDLQKLFPIYKNQIKTFYSTYNVLEKSNPNEFMKKIALYINSLKLENEK